MYCAECGHENENNNKFCSECGVPMENYEDNESKKINVLQFFKNNILKVLGVFLVIIILLIATIIFKGYKNDNEIKSVGTIFNVDDKLYAVRNNEEAVEISDDFDPLYYDIDDINIVSNEDYIYFIEDDNLRVNNYDGDSKKLGSDVDSIVVSKNGDRVLFLKDVDYDTETGDLYLSIKGKKAEKIDRDVPLNGFIFGENEKEILYVADFEEDGGTLYFKDGKKDKEEIEDEIYVPIYASNGGKKIFYATYEEAFDLYMKEGKKSSEKIEKYLEGVLLNINTGAMVCFTEDEELYYYKIGEYSDKIDKDISDILLFNVDFVYKPKNSTKIVYQVDLDSLIMVYETDDEEVMLWVEGNEPVLISDEYIYDIIVSQDNKYIYYIDDGNLYYKEIKDNNLSDKEKVASDVEDYIISKDGKHVAFESKGELYYKQLEKDEIEIGEDVSLFAIVDDTVIFIADDDLYFSKKGKEKEKIDSDIVNFYSYNSTGIYYNNEDKELYYYEIGKKRKLIYDDVDDIRLIYKK